jgi:hypothetical protein
LRCPLVQETNAASTSVFCLKRTVVRCQTTTDMNPEAQLSLLIKKFSPDIAALARSVLVKMRARLPGAIELVYDNYNALAIGFAPTERPSDAIFSIAIYPRWVSLFLLQWAPDLPDPAGLLKGAGKRTRHIVLTNAGKLDEPAVLTLMTHALRRARVHLNPSTSGRLVIRSISAKQRPRLPVSCPIQGTHRGAPPYRPAAGPRRKGRG